MPADLNGWLSHLEQLHPKSIALGLDRVQQVRERMGLAPAFPVITVAGTNGKGSTCAMLERILTEAGYRVGCYTSPHLLRYNERVRIHCQEAEDTQLCRAFAAVEAARGDMPLTYFEYGTLAAVWLMVAANVEVAVLEIGLGGRLDAVNAFDPDCAIVTTIDLDHMDYLGDTRESIGREKAGVFRRGIPAICGELDPPVAVTAYAQDIGADYRQLGVNFDYELESESWTFRFGEHRLSGLPLPALRGSFQLANAACALAALYSIESRLPVTQDAIREGLANVSLRGRYQTVALQPRTIVDVAHNPHAARSLAENLRRDRPEGRTIAVFAMLADKDIAGVVEALKDEIDQWLVAGIAQPRGLASAALKAIVDDHVQEGHAHAFENVSEALRHACFSAGPKDRIVAFGSFYTVADVLRTLPVPTLA